MISEDTTIEKKARKIEQVKSLLASAISRDMLGDDIVPIICKKLSKYCKKNGYDYSEIDTRLDVVELLLKENS
jgi:hypothetical protein